MCVSSLASGCVGVISESRVVGVDDRNALSGTAACFGRIISIHFQEGSRKVSHSESGIPGAMCVSFLWEIIISVLANDECIISVDADKFLTESSAHLLIDDKTCRRSSMKNQ